MKDIFKKLLKTATQILKLGDNKTIAASENFIGTGYFAIKKGLIKTFDTAFTKRATDIKNLNYEKLIPRVINNDYQLVENIEVRKNYTQLISKSVTSYLNTSYYVFFNNYIKDLQLYVKNAVDPVIMTNKNNEVLGILLPIRVKNHIVLKGSGMIDSEIVDIDKSHVYVDVRSLDHEEKDKLQDIGFKRFSKDRYIKVFSHDILRKLGFNLSHEFFENDMTLEELKEELKQKEIKKEIEQNMINESYEKLLPFYQNIINNLINDGYEIKELSIKLSPQKTCYDLYIDTDKKEFDLGFICNKGNLNLNKTQQKALFKMLNDNLVLENINSINENKEIEHTLNSIKLVSGYYLPKDIKFEKSYNNNFYTFSFHVDKNLKSEIFISGSNEGGEMEVVTNIDKFNNIEMNAINTYIQNKFNELMEVKNMENKNNDLEKFIKFAKSLDIKIYQNYRRIALQDDYLVDCFNNNYDINVINLIEFMHNELSDNNKLINFPYNFNTNETQTIEGSSITHEVNMDLQLLASTENKQYNLKPIHNDYIESNKEYQIEQLKLYNSNTLNFQKKRVNHKMIEEYTKYFIYDNKRFMAVKPAKDGIYPSSYYTHVKQYNSLVDVDNKIILFLDEVSLETLEGVKNA